jgi:hypothetical protein
MISFVCWKWRTAGSARLFLAEHVNVLRAMVKRYYARPFRFICITDDRAGLDKKIEAIAMPVRFEIQSPHGARFPSCYARLWNFSREAAVLGKTIFQTDIDVVITGDLTPLVDREEDFVGWSDKRFQRNKIAGGAYLLRTGSLPHVWEEFDPIASPAAALAAGHMGSDQAWMSYCLSPESRVLSPESNPGSALSPQHSALKKIGTWNGAGLVKINWTPARARRAPQGARMVFTSGEKPPWSSEQRRRYPWIKDHWR